MEYLISRFFSSTCSIRRSNIWSVDEIEFLWYFLLNWKDGLFGEMQILGCGIKPCFFRDILLRCCLGKKPEHSWGNSRRKDPPLLFKAVLPDSTGKHLFVTVKYFAGPCMIYQNLLLTGAQNSNYLEYSQQKVLRESSFLIKLKATWSQPGTRKHSTVNNSNQSFEY